MRHSLFDWSVRTALIAVLVIALPNNERAGAQCPPPAGGVCMATITNVNVPAPVKAYNWATHTWQYTWNWTIDYVCDGAAGDMTNCKACAQNQYWLLDPVYQGGNSVRLGTSCNCGNFQTCGFNYQLGETTVFPSTGQLQAGSSYQVDFLANPYDDASNGVCSNQNYTWYESYNFVAPTPLD